MFCQSRTGLLYDERKDRCREKYKLSDRDTFKRVRVPLLNDIHYGGQIGSRNRKRGWVLYWHELIPDELGQGG